MRTTVSCREKAFREPVWRACLHSDQPEADIRNEGDHKQQEDDENRTLSPKRPRTGFDQRIRLEIDDSARDQHSAGSRIAPNLDSVALKNLAVYRLATHANRNCRKSMVVGALHTERQSMDTGVANEGVVLPSYLHTASDTAYDPWL
jgi:hypothetical protein